MSSVAERIVAAIKETGPQPRSMLHSLGASPAEVDLALEALIADDKIHREGAGRGAKYAIGKGKASAGKKKRKKAKKARTPRQPREKEEDAPTSFVPAITADSRLVIVQDGANPTVYSTAETSAIAALMLAHFQT